MNEWLKAVSVVIIATVRVQSQCPLLWNSKQMLGYGSGLQLQACCSLSSVKIWYLNVTGNWSLGELAHEKNFTNTSSSIWTSLQVTICDDKPEPTLGYAEARDGVNCTHHRGYTTNIQPRAMKFNKWFLICYASISGCVQCHIETLCLNEFTRECLNLWMQSSVSTITNTSMIAWVDFGERYPFLEWSELRIKVIDQLRGETVGFFTKKEITKRSVELHVENLKPNGWYVVEICTKIYPPQTFLDNYMLNESLNDDSRQMCQRGLYRTKSFAKKPNLHLLCLILVLMYSSVV